MAVGEQVDRAVERLLDVAEGLLGGLEVLLGLGDLGGQAVLLLLEQVEGHCAGVVGVQELLALAGERGEPPALARGFLLACSRMPESARPSLARIASTWSAGRRSWA